MAYDEELADRVREQLAEEPALTERKMFGGLAFLVGGKMAVAVSGQGGLMVRVEPEETDALRAEPYTHAFEMNGRDLEGWVRVDATGVGTERELAAWVRRGATYARGLT